MTVSEQCEGYENRRLPCTLIISCHFLKLSCHVNFQVLCKLKLIREANRPNKPPSGNRVRAESSKVSKMLAILHFGKYMLRVTV